MSYLVFDLETGSQETYVRKGNPVGECVEFSGCKNIKGYGILTVHNKTVSAHRLVYRLYIGELKPGFVICHKCDNPACINPNHLYQGTPKDNSRDMVQRGRSTSGTQNVHNKLLDNEVIEIRNLINQGISDYKIASMFN